jgi:hypothetical protein
VGVGDGVDLGGRGLLHGGLLEAEV